MTDADEQPLELILARNLVSLISLGAILVDSEGAIVFYNDAASRILGARFEGVRRIPEETWRAEIGPFDQNGRQLPAAELPVATALRDGRPGHGRFHIRGDAGLVPVEATALPLVGSTGHHGALVVFWPGVGDGGA